MTEANGQVGLLGAALDADLFQIFVGLSFGPTPNDEPAQHHRKVRLKFLRPGWDLIGMVRHEFLHALDIGAMTIFFYCFREREKILNLIEAASGGRMTPSWTRSRVVLTPRRWCQACGSIRM